MSVVIPVRDGGTLFADVLAALSRQTVAHELIVCDSGSRDGSPRLAREHGARVIEIEPERFSHGATRNLLLAASAGAHVALLTQDAVPAGERWLQELLDGFALADEVALVYGPYRPRAGASPAVAIELDSWFDSLSPDGTPRVERLDEDERSDLPASGLIGRRGFFTDANACIARAAWERIPFREVPYAEDRVLAIDMLRAGYAKAFVPQAAVIHSHAYTPFQQLRRCFDEWRGLREVYGWREPASPRHVLSRLRGSLGQARRAPAVQGASSGRRLATLAAVAAHEGVCLAGALLGSHADRLPPSVRRTISLEGHARFDFPAHGPRE
ncbi:MAG TPA: glycosyltransferase [Solirubrobacteraceae bacterium]|nr:glycosyltransferase [Solirubrobacteraceae bacterium]